MSIPSMHEEEDYHKTWERLMNGGVFFVFNTRCDELIPPSSRELIRFEKVSRDNIGNRNAEYFSKIFITYERIFPKFSTRGNDLQFLG